MFELSIAAQYILPRRRQLYRSLIGLISICVIAVVVWLILVFFSVTNGLEKQWVEKLTALTAPIRALPTEAYYRSYFHQIDQFSESTGYKLLSISEKRESQNGDPYNPDFDQELPLVFPAPDLNEEGLLRDPVGGLFKILSHLELQAHPFEIRGTQLKLDLLRFAGTPLRGEQLQEISFSYPVYVKEADVLSATHPLILPLEGKDWDNLLISQVIEAQHNTKTPFSLQSLIERYFNHITLKKVTAKQGGSMLPSHALPSHGKWDVLVTLKGGQVLALYVTQQSQEREKKRDELEQMGEIVRLGTVHFGTSRRLLIEGVEYPHLLDNIPFLAAPGTTFDVMQFIQPKNAVRLSDLEIDMTAKIQGIHVSLQVPFRNLEIEEVLQDSLWDRSHWIQTVQGKEGIILPKGFRDRGVRMGDKASVRAFVPTPTGLRDEELATYVAGFYDPGIIPIGGKLILAPSSILAFLRSPMEDAAGEQGMQGINIELADLSNAELFRQKIVSALKAAKIDRYWSIDTYRNFEFAKPILDEIQGQKAIFLLIAFVVMIVACSNIISMLILLVNDKKQEIGILRSMGATGWSIGLIFGTAGASIGLIGSLLGVFLAWMTLANLEWLLGWVGRFQGEHILSRALYGQAPPHELSGEALFFVCMITAFLSILAGVLPAIKAARLQPTQILRKEEG